MPPPTHRIALDCRLLHWPGVGRYCAEMARALVEVAPDLDFVWLCAPGGERHMPAAPNARALVTRARPFSASEQIELALLLRRGGVRLVHAPTSSTLPVLAPRLVVTVHDLILKRFPEFLASRIGRGYYNLMLLAAVKRARRIIAVSEFTRRDVVASWPAADGKTRTILNGVGAGFHPVTDRDALSDTRRRLGLPPGYVLYVGTRKRHKNLPRLLEAYSRLTPSQRAKAPLVLLAPPDSRYPEADALIASCGIAGDVHALADVADDDLPALYSMARCVALVSLYEGFGFPVVEAQACGTPTLIADAASLPEVAGEASLSADPNDAGSIRAALARLIDDDALRAGLAARAPAAAARFSWRRAATQVAEVYREALA